ncbi:MAG: Maf family protein, partial [Gemmatimonadota bacterium]
LLGLEFEVRVPETDEAWMPDEAPPVAARRLAERKLAAVSGGPDEIILAADTLVALAGEPLGKPRDAPEAIAMLERLAGRRHTVFTGLALAMEGRIESGVRETKVWVRPVDRVECAEYVATGEPLDKAGAYGIQGLGAALVERIEGEYFNVMGLPVQLFLELLGRFRLRYAFGRLEAR